jgi:hypothetical protein
MARVGTPNWNLGTWLLNESPGAGSQTVDNNALNGNWLKLDKVGLEHNPDGTHKAAVIDCTNLKSTVADGVSIEQDGSTKKLKVKLLSITSGFLGAGSVIAGKLLGTGTGKVVDGTSIQLNGSNELEVKDGGISSAKIASNAVTTEKLEYKECVLLITQVSTLDPQLVVVKNTLGADFTAARASTGTHSVVASSAVLTNFKTSVITQSINGFFYATKASTSAINFFTKDTAGTLTDGLLSYHTMIIRVYP